MQWHWKVRRRFLSHKSAGTITIGEIKKASDPNQEGNSIGESTSNTNPIPLPMQWHWHKIQDAIRRKKQGS